MLERGLSWYFKRNSGGHEAIPDGLRIDLGIDLGGDPGFRQLPVTGSVKVIDGRGVCPPFSLPLTAKGAI
jgi:hypothetical protein